MMKIRQDKIRNSSVEFLKVIAIFLIMVAHVTQTLSEKTNLLNIPLSTATEDIQSIILMIFLQGGGLGNAIFFICSAWFLIDNNKFARKKAFSLLATVWNVSILIFCFYLLIGNHDITTNEIIRQIFPTTFANNWYMTCYIIFLFTYPWLNRLITIINQKQLLRMVLFSSFLWIFMCYLLKNDPFFSSKLMLWIAIYLLIAYLKLYCNSIVTSKRIGVILIVVGIIGYIGQVVITNYVGLYLFSFFSNKVLYWNTNYCPFHIMIALGSLIVALKSNFESKCINYIASLSMLAYLIHENILFRTYTRPLIWEYLYRTYTFDYVVLLDLVYAFVLFIIVVIISALYKETIQKLVTKVSNKIYPHICNIYSKIENIILTIK